MKSYGLSMGGALVIEKVQILPTWTASLVGRMLYAIPSGAYWIAGDSSDDGIDGWIQFGLTNRGVVSNYVRWDDNFDDPTAISSEDIPTHYLDSTSNVQVAINSITDNITALTSGTDLADGSIHARHIGFDSTDVPFANTLGKYDVSYENVEQVLNFLRHVTANNVLFFEPHSFGTGIGSSADNVQQALLDIDEYLSNLIADNIKALIPSTSVWSSVQSILDMIFSNIENISLSSLVGTPDNYGINKQFVRTNGVDSLYYSDIYASDVICQYPGVQQTTVQGALSIINSSIDELAGGNLNIDASDISYDDSPSIGINNVDDALDYLIRECFTSSNLPTAAQISTHGIGISENVQSALEYLQVEIEALLANAGITSVRSPITPLILSANATVTLDNVNQDYLLLTHTYGGTSKAAVAVSARIVINTASQDGDLIASINDVDVITVDKGLLYPGYTILLTAKMELSPNDNIDLNVKSVDDGCTVISVKNYRMLIEPAL